MHDSLARKSKTAGRDPLRTRPRLELLETRDVPTTFFVSPTGGDAPGNGTQAAPFQHIQYAVNQAASDDVIKVAGGTYTFLASLDPDAAARGTTAVVVDINKRLTIVGGYSTSNWTTPDLTANPTIIDGQNQVRGVLMLGAGPTGSTGLDLENFIVRNGLATRNPMQSVNSNSFIYGEGGGIYLDLSQEQNSSVATKLSNVTIQNCVAQGADTTFVVGGQSFNYGGFGVGGGLFGTFVNNLQLNQVTVTGNRAVGGNGKLMAGAALGGGVWLDTCHTTATNISVTNNTAIGGSTTGPNTTVEGRFPEVDGGGIFTRADPANPGRSSAVFQNLTLTGNQAIGGSTTNTAAGSAGADAVGGGSASEYSTLTFSDSIITGNSVVAGAGYNGGTGDGGGIRTSNDQITVQRSVIENNTVTSGTTTNNAGGGRFGPLGGGGLYLTNFDPTFPRTVTITNSVIANNTLSFPSGGNKDATQNGGAGAGIWFQGTLATLDGVTIAQNKTDDRLIFGMGMYLITTSPLAGPTDVTVKNSIISDHHSNSAAVTGNPAAVTPAVTVHAGSTIRLQNVLYAANDLNDNSADPPTAFFTPGTFAQHDVVTAASAGYTSPGSPNFDYSLTATSPARNAATGTPQAVDLFNNNRLATDPPTADIGAIEFGSHGTNLGRQQGGSTTPPPPTNTAPTVSQPPSQVVPAGQTSVAFTVTLGDSESTPDQLTLAATSSNTGLIPNSGITLSGTGATRTVTVVPTAGQSGNATITLTVTDPGGLTSSVSVPVAVGGAVSTTPATLIGYPQFSVAPGAGGGSVATLYGPDATRLNTGGVLSSPAFSGGVRTASADFNGDGIADLVVGTGPGTATLVQVLSGTDRTLIFSVNPFEAAFTGGVYVAAGDLNGDGKPELIITPDEGGGPRVRVFSGNGFGLMADFFGIDDTNFRGGARAAAGDVNGDGAADLVVVAGFQGGPRVAGFDGKAVAAGSPQHIFGDFFAFEQTLRNGVFVTVGDVNGDGFADVVAGGGPGGGPRVTVFDGKSLMSNQYTPLANFFAGDANNRGGVHIAVKNLDNDNQADLVVGGGVGATPLVTGYLGKSIVGSANPPSQFSFNAFDTSFTGGVFVG